MNLAAIPPSPPGYQPARPFVYPKTILNIIGLGLLLAVAPLLFGLTWLMQGRPAYFSVGGDNLVVTLLVVVITLIITIITHELFHGLAYYLLGYKVSYGVSLHLLAAYAAAFEQWQPRLHNLATALTPLVFLTLLLLPLLAAPYPLVVVIGFTAILFNISGAIGDLYLSWRLLGLPPGTLMYDADIHTMLIYEPM